MNGTKRVMIVGQPGSGKSTLARQLGPVFDLPVVHIDLIHWQSGWVERSVQDKGRLCEEVHARDKWIFEGGHSTTWPQRLARADTLIWLDLPFPVRVWRVIVRTLRHYGKSRPDLPDGCPEKFSLEFALWIWNARRTGREKMRRLYESVPAEKKKYRLRSASEVRDFVESLC